MAGDMTTLIPLSFIPLDPDVCSCQSLEELARKTESPLEHDCRTNEHCNGIRCVLDAYRSTYHVETILLTCEDPPALDVVVENERNEPLYAAKFNRSGVYSIEVAGLTLPLYAVLEHRDYSVDIEVSWLASRTVCNSGTHSFSK